MKQGISSSFDTEPPNTARTIRPFVDVFAGRFLSLARKSSALLTVWILLKAKTILLSCQAKQGVSWTIVITSVFQGSFVENRVFSSTKLSGNSLYSRVILIAPKLQARNSVNKGINIK